MTNLSNSLGCIWPWREENEQPVDMGKKLKGIIGRNMFLSAINSTFRNYFNSHLRYRRTIELIPVSEKTIVQWISMKRIFFVVSTGRTGTKWLADLLGRCANVLVEHEPVPLETFAHKVAVGNTLSAEKYIAKFRLKEIYLRVASKHPELNVYGEVNGALRRHIVPIRTYIPEVRMIHLVRDGKDVVRSIMSRGTYSGKHPVYHDFRPPKVDRFSERWEELSEFEKTCWVWQWENQYMRQHIDQCARFEDITSSYEFFEKQILEPLDLDLRENAWKTEAKRPQNVSSKYALGKWDQWTSEQKDQFAHICGEEMEHYGYEI
jgi:hypothetical protein